uniref:Uncharacterized protein n=1 Tax=Phlebotomus papatasi TaxID=29031 RepID=A0A1B0D892_PHLPP
MANVGGSTSGLVERCCRRNSSLCANHKSTPLIPSIIGIHYGWTKVQNVESLVKEHEKQDLPIVINGGVVPQRNICTIFGRCCNLTSFGIESLPPPAHNEAQPHGQGDDGKDHGNEEEEEELIFHQFPLWHNHFQESLLDSVSVVVHTDTNIVSTILFRDIVYDEFTQIRITSHELLPRRFNTLKCALQVLDDMVVAVPCE